MEPICDEGVWLPYQHDPARDCLVRQLRFGEVHEKWYHPTEIVRLWTAVREEIIVSIVRMGETQ